jgi:hypothetical protein
MSGSSGHAGSAGAAVEICDNGIDDDGDTLVDCGDTDCTSQGFACLSVPMGWGLVAYAADARNACPLGYNGGSTDIVSGVSGADLTCACGCMTTKAGDCADGTGYWTDAGTDSSCQAVADMWMTTVTDGCGTLPDVIVDMSHYYLYGFDAASGTCTHSADKLTTPPIEVAHPGETCSVSKVGAGCGAGVCASPSGSDFTRCVFRPGMNACPPGYSKQTYIGQATDGTAGYDDGRVCMDGCGCDVEPPECTGVTASYFLASTCGGGMADGTQATNCFKYTEPWDISSVRFGGTGTPTSCTTSGSTSPMGSVTLHAEATVCCP